MMFVPPWHRERGGSNILPLASNRHPSDVAWEKVQREEEAVIYDLAVEAHVQQAYNIYEAAQSGSGINVYHITAFFPRPSIYLRALLCVTLQLVVVPSIIVNTVENAPSYCPRTGTWTGKLAGAALLVYANFTLISQRFTFSKSWDYAYIEKNVGLPKLVRQPTWIPLGIIINIIALAAANLGVVVLLSLKEGSPMDMLLNLVALTFVWELDDQLMSKREYKAVEILFREMAQGRQLKDVSQNLKARGFFEARKVNQCWKYLALFLDKGIIYPLYVVMFASPVFHAICY